MQMTEENMNSSKRVNKNQLWALAALQIPIYTFILMPKSTKDFVNSAIAIPMTEPWLYFAFGIVPLAMLVTIAVEFKKDPSLKQSPGVVYRALMLGLALMWFFSCITYTSVK